MDRTKERRRKDDGTFALPGCVWDANKEDKNMTGTGSSAEQCLPPHHDGVVNLSNGLSIKGAAARRRQALEHASTTETAATSVDQGNALLEISMESTALPVSESTKGRDEEITTTINNPSVNAEIASVGKHLTTTAPTLDNYPLPHNYPDETGAQSGTSRTSISDMPPLQSAGFSRTANGEVLRSDVGPCLAPAPNPTDSHLRHFHSNTFGLDQH
ncbi:MAG: hypothetical protein Q9180_001580 [Flavoplaca navasiana]